MKRLTALLTTLAMAMPAVALADVRVEHRDRDRGISVTFNRDRYDGGYNRSHWQRDFRGRWVALGGQYNAETDIQAIHLDGRRYSKLRIEGTRGEPVIARMQVEFGNGTKQMVDLNMRLAPGVGEVIDLSGVGDRKINQIVVFSAPRTRGTFSVYGG